MIILKNKSIISKLEQSGTIAKKILNVLYEEAVTGVTTHYLDTIAGKLIKDSNAIASFNGYRGFKHNICTSINEEAVHGIPSNRKLKKNDLLSVDIGILYDGVHGDTAWTKLIGNNNKLSESNRLLTTTKECLYNAISLCRDGQRVGNIGNIISKTASCNGFSIVRTFGGHGVGKNLHEYPFIPNYGSNNSGVMLKVGSVIAIEPILTSGNGNVYIKHDGWTVCTEDNKLSSHFEHTVLVTKDGYKILT